MKNIFFIITFFMVINVFSSSIENLIGCYKVLERNGIKVENSKYSYGIIEDGVAKQIVSIQGKEIPAYTITYFYNWDDINKFNFFHSFNILKEIGTINTTGDNKIIHDSTGEFIGRGDPLNRKMEYLRNHIELFSAEDKVVATRELITKKLIQETSGGNPNYYDVETLIDQVLLEKAAPEFCSFFPKH